VYSRAVKNPADKELDIEVKERRSSLFGNPMDIPVDPDGPVNAVEGKRNLDALEQDAISSSRIQLDAAVFEGSLEELPNERFPVHVVLAEKTRIMDPPCKVCGNLDPKNFNYLDGSPGTHGWLDFNLNEPTEASSLECFSCLLIRAICQPYEGNIRYCQLMYLSQETDTSGLRLRLTTNYDDSRELDLEICAPEGTARLFPSVSHRSLTWDATIASRQISQWLDGCSADHDCYDVSSSPVLPTRLLEIQGPHQVRLYLSGTDERGLYACLSHCWGGVVPLQSLRATLEAFQQGISWDTLPRTFQDAIDVARCLGLKFLWIDSLCIVQDDADDWLRESSKMASVYFQAYVTLAASQAANSTEGLFPDPSLMEYKKLYTASNYQGLRYDTFVRRAPYIYDKKGLPLATRAWFAQEQMLSPRTVHFTESFLYLSCFNEDGFTCSDQNNIYPPRPYVHFLGKQVDLNKQRSRPETWHGCVRHYSHLSLTYPKDAFPALQGVAKHIQTERQSTYYAGIWGDNVLNDLLWRKWSRAADLNVAKYLAPTWSWASRSGSLSWHTDVNVDWDPEGIFHLDAVCISISTTPAGDDPMGEIVAGKLQLQGHCVSAVWLDQKSDDALHYLELEDASYKAASWEPDIEPSCLPDRSLTIILIGVGRNFPGWLVLRRISRDREEYERVGFFEGGSTCTAYDFLHACRNIGERKVVTIF
jgi:hypothetical protein